MIHLPALLRGWLARLADLSPEDLTTFDWTMADLAGIRYGGVRGST